MIAKFISYTDRFSALVWALERNGGLLPFNDNASVLLSSCRLLYLFEITLVSSIVFAFLVTVGDY